MICDEWFAKKVAQRRRGRKLSAQDLAMITGMSRMTITHIETGKQRIFLWQALILAKILNINLMRVPIFKEDEIK